MSLTRAQAQPIYTMGKQEVLGYSYPQDYTSTNVQSALTEIAQGLTWRERAQPGDTLIVDQNGEQVPAVYNIQNGTGRFVPIGMDQVQVYRDGILQQQAVDYVETTVSDNITISNLSNLSFDNVTLANAGGSNIATNSQIEELKDEIQLLKDEIENLKMLLLEN